MVPPSVGKWDVVAHADGDEPALHGCLDIIRDGAVSMLAKYCVVVKRVPYHRTRYTLFPALNQAGVRFSHIPQVPGGTCSHYSH